MIVDQDCDFCAIVASEEPAREVLRNEHVVAFFPLEPATLGHTLIIPREHVPDVWTLTDVMANHLTRATLIVATALREALDIQGLNVIQSNGVAATQTVMHLHVHLVPRYENDAMGRIWPVNTGWSVAAKTETQRKVRVALRTLQGGSKP